MSNRRGGSDPSDHLRIAILGAGGFIGSHLVEHLIAEGRHGILGVDVTDEKLSGIASSNFTFLQADIRHDADVMDDVVRTADVVVDLVAYANPSIYVTAPLEVFDLNFIQNLEVAKRCIKYGKRLIQYSSAEVYGKASAGEAYSEDDTDGVFGPVQKQRWIYANAKMLLERVLYAHGAAGELDYTIVRPFNFIGSRIDYLVPANAIGGPRVFPHFMSALLTGGPIRLVDGGHAKRAFLHIDDANRAFQTLLEHPVETRNQIYNVGNAANNATIREVALTMVELYEELTGIPSVCQLVEITGEEFYGPGYEDATRLPPDTAKIRALGWAPRYDLRSTLRDAMLYYLTPTRNGSAHSEPRVSLNPATELTNSRASRLEGTDAAAWLHGRGGSPRRIPAADGAGQGEAADGRQGSSSSSVQARAHAWWPSGTPDR